MFLTPLGYNVYSLGTFEYLQPVLDYFGTDAQSPFIMPSAAVKSGWTTSDVLNPTQSAQFGCFPNVTPLLCEYTFSNPSFAIIMFGTNDATAMTVNEFETNLDQIVQITLDEGIVPMLSTVPTLLLPNQDVTDYNLAVIRVALRHHVPVVNLWLAMQPLPNRGISDDWVHPSGPPSNAGTTLFLPEYIEYGYTIRNLVTLQGLEMLLRAVIIPPSG